MHPFGHDPESGQRRPVELRQHRAAKLGAYVEGFAAPAEKAAVCERLRDLVQTAGLLPSEDHPMPVSADPGERRKRVSEFGEHPADLRVADTERQPRAG